ncbi:hypothetical protein M413DRAFT_174418 [Hebeloma cylindrosporum]|uniref:Uncharacterized protein n=1 Tax=Hebeloma cylindrosporum TaxID=76867 RepID=A0A0C3C9H4_HEBCY|nr:hypothetical protein M413DRAFT_174418 [Hebeloma cylindrosporum h7]
MYVCGMMAVVAMISENWRESDDFGAGHTCLIAEKVFRRQMRRHSSRSRVQYAFWGGERRSLASAEKHILVFLLQQLPAGDEGKEALPCGCLPYTAMGRVRE